MIIKIVGQSNTGKTTHAIKSINKDETVLYLSNQFIDTSFITKCFKNEYYEYDDYSKFLKNITLVCTNDIINFFNALTLKLDSLYYNHIIIDDLSSALPDEKEEFFKRLSDFSDMYTSVKITIVETTGVPLLRPNDLYD